MKFIKKALKLAGFVIIIALASIGLGINAATMPSFNRNELIKPTTEIVESKEEESEAENEAKE